MALQEIVHVGVGVPSLLVETLVVELFVVVHLSTTQRKREFSADPWRAKYVVFGHYEERTIGYWWRSMRVPGTNSVVFADAISGRPLSICDKDQSGESARPQAVW